MQFPKRSNILESFSNGGDDDFCEAFLTKIKEIIQVIFIPNSQIDLTSTTNMKKPLEVKSKLEDFKKLFSRIKNKSIDEDKIDPVCKQACKLLEEANKKITAFIEQTIAPINPLNKIAHQTLVEFFISFIDSKSAIQLFLTRNYFKTDVLEKDYDEAIATRRKLTNIIDQTITLNSFEVDVSRSEIKIVGDVHSECLEKTQGDG